jgi:hypothetical protein
MSFKTNFGRPTHLPVRPEYLEYRRAFRRASRTLRGQCKFAVFPLGGILIGLVWIGEIDPHRPSGIGADRTIRLFRRNKNVMSRFAKGVNMRPSSQRYSVKIGLRGWWAVWSCWCCGDQMSRCLAPAMETPSLITARTFLPPHRSAFGPKRTCRLR